MNIRTTFSDLLCWVLKKVNWGWCCYIPNWPMENVFHKWPILKLFEFFHFWFHQYSWIWSLISRNWPRVWSYAKKWPIRFQTSNGVRFLPNIWNKNEGFLKFSRETTEKVENNRNTCIPVTILHVENTIWTLRCLDTTMSLILMCSYHGGAFVKQSLKVNILFTWQTCFLWTLPNVRCDMVWRLLFYLYLPS